MKVQIADEDVRARAYELWEARGRPDGSAEDDWFAAEEQLRAERDAGATPLEPLTIEAPEALEPRIANILEPVSVEAPDDPPRVLPAATIARIRRRPGKSRLSQ